MSDLEARALDLFDEYVDLAPLQRSAALARLKDRDSPLHDALLRLLSADAAAHPLEVAAFDLLGEASTEGDDDDASARVGNRLGPWRIDRVLGSGGMGTVYGASRADGQYEKQVALKCMRAEISSPALIDAFMRERNHLAQLDHPHIAPLLDGGVEADGRPWFAMRLVHGTAMDLWADQQRLGLAERMRLLLQACQALRYAHDHGVLHQDIKPGNLLVSTDGRVHLVDFGLSAVTGSLHGAAAPRIAVSNGYTPPDVLSGAAASVASDVYSIGVMLYQLLVGDWPRPLLPLHASLIGLPSMPARAPSALAMSSSPELARKRGGLDPRRLRKRLQGDLDAIAMKAVALAPEDRYASVDALIDDLERWLTRHPVVARGGRRTYVFGRFLQRNALASALAASVVVVGTAGAGVLGWLHRQDRQTLHDAQAVSSVFEQTLGSVTLSGLADTRPSSRHLLGRTEAGLRALSLDASPAIKARALAALARSYAALGDYRQALALAGEAHGLLSNDAAGDADTQAMLAMLLNLQARHAEARDVATQGLQRSTSTQTSADPSTLGLLVELARAHWGLSEYDAAFDALAFAQRSAAGTSSQTALDMQVELLVLRAQWHLQLLDLTAADIELQNAARAAHASAPTVKESVSEAMLPLLMLRERYAEASERATALFDARRQRLGAHHPDTARSLRLQLDVASRTPGNAALATTAVQAAHEAILATYGARHPEYAQLLLLEARVASRGDAGKGAALSRQAVQLLESTLGPRHPTTLDAKEEQATALLAFAHQTPAMSAPLPLREAISLLQEVIHATGQRHWPSPGARHLLAQALLQRARLAGPTSVADRRQAETLLQDALVEASRHFGARHASTTTIRATLVRDYQPDAAQAGPQPDHRLDDAPSRGGAPR
ncbi:serine/threonine-protein kinase [Pseudoxanthomonas sp. LjRoot143]|uniref:serine/threonine-protein kinase n=1 Tax=Pseudoxanthomonas sp. LjRoot143 TaxID=3342266 RepID=UPI003ED0A102